MAKDGACWPIRFIASTWQGAEHPERPERFDAVMDGLRSAGLLERLGALESRTATEDELVLCHTREYLQMARRDVESGRPYLSTGDTDITPNSWDVAIARGGRRAERRGCRVARARRAMPSARFGRRDIMPRAAAAWASACSTTWPWRRAMRSGGTAWSAC